MENETQVLDLSINDIIHFHDAAVIPYYVDSRLWKKAVADLRNEFAFVTVEDLRFLIHKLNAGEINGIRSSASQGYGCFVATIGHHILPTLPDIGQSWTDWEAFNYKYHLIRKDSPFQSWLFGVHPGDTPKNNVIARAFADELQKMIDEREALDSDERAK